MKKKLSYIILLFALILSLSSCAYFSSFNKTGNETSTPTQTLDVSASNKLNINSTAIDTFKINENLAVGNYKIKYDCNNGHEYEYNSSSSNTILKPTTNPTKIASTFLGWYYDLAYNNEVDFNNAISSNITIYAKWTTNYAELTNYITTNAMLSNMRVNAVFRESRYSASYASSLGSGVIVGENENYYFLLTNHHVVYANYRYASYTVEDAYENSYQATVLYKDSTYDLALMYFRKGEKTLTILPMATVGPKVNDYVIALGEPLGQSNTIRYGIYTDLYKFKPSKDTIDESNVTFDVYRHTAYIDNGSSGGALIDTNLRLIGVNFASATENNEYKNSYAVPYYKAMEFINIALNQ